MAKSKIQIKSQVPNSKVQINYNNETPMRPTRIQPKRIAMRQFGMNVGGLFSEEFIVGGAVGAAAVTPWPPSCGPTPTRVEPGLP